jgi:cell division protein FtsB
VAVVGLVSIAMLSSLAQEINRRVQINREVALLETEVNRLERSIVELDNLNQYFKTDAYQERLAREKLNYVAEGEQVVLIPEEVVEQSRGQVAGSRANQEDISNLAKWWRIFFVDQYAPLG